MAFYTAFMAYIMYKREHKDNEGKDYLCFFFSSADLFYPLIEGSVSWLFGKQFSVLRSFFHQIPAQRAFSINHTANLRCD